MPLPTSSAYTEATVLWLTPRKPASPSQPPFNSSYLINPDAALLAWMDELKTKIEVAVVI